MATIAVYNTEMTHPPAPYIPEEWEARAQWRFYPTGKDTYIPLYKSPAPPHITQSTYLTDNKCINNTSFKNEVLDRMGSLVSDMPKYQSMFDEIMTHFTIDGVLTFLRSIDKDSDFKRCKYRNVYSVYFDEIEEMIFRLDSNGY